jgi:hypothetical protein
MGSIPETSENPYIKTSENPYADGGFADLAVAAQEQPLPGRIFRCHSSEGASKHSTHMPIIYRFYLFAGPPPSSLG